MLGRHGTPDRIRGKRSILQELSTAVSVGRASGKLQGTMTAVFFHAYARNSGAYQLPNCEYSLKLMSSPPQNTQNN
jgi:hypothetical protein